MKLRDTCTLIVGKRTLLSVLSDGLSNRDVYEHQIEVTSIVEGGRSPNGTEQFVLTIEPAFKDANPIPKEYVR